MKRKGKLGIVGGGGQLGSAIALGLIRAGAVTPDDLWVSTRSGRANALADWPGIRITHDNQTLSDACETVLISVPPAAFGNISIRASDRLVISVTAGVTRARLAAETGARRVIRAMSSPSAADGLAYSPWIGSADLTAADIQEANSLFSAIGKTDELSDEAHIDQFTAMTGPVPGFVALFADCMARHAVAQGIAPDIADRAIRQLFLASGKILSDTPSPAAEHVKAMVDYAGTTAAGISAMEAAGLAEVIQSGLTAAAQKARTISVG